MPAVEAVSLGECVRGGKAEWQEAKPELDANIHSAAPVTLNGL